MRFLFQPQKKALFLRLSKAFPEQCAADVAAVIEALHSIRPVKVTAFYFDHTAKWQLPSGEQITLPYRICISDKLRHGCKLTAQQQIILHCIGSRSPDGYVRQKHIEALLAADLPIRAGQRQAGLQCVFGARSRQGFWSRCSAG